MPPQSALKRLMQPRSIAVVGASTKARIGMAMLTNNDEIGFDGPLYPVNPNYNELAGRKCFPSLSAIPEPPDCAVIVVPARVVLSVVEEAGKIGVQSAIIVAQGFGEAGTDEGHARQAQLREVADRYGMAVAGPNCLGLGSFHYRFANSYSDLPKSGPGGISIMSQSGGLLNAAAAYAADRSAGLNYMISFGNQAVVEAADYMDYLAGDEATTVIACIMEGAPDGRRFRDAIERAARKKPMVIQKLGRSESGKRATLAHTGTLAGDDRAYVSLFRQNGIAMAESLDSMMETAFLFDRARILPTSDRVGMVTISGGTTGLIADVGEAAGLKFPVLTPETEKSIQAVMGVDHPLTNPVDTTSWPQLTNPGCIDGYLDALLGDDGIDIVGVAFRIQAVEVQHGLFTSLAARARTATKPIVGISTVSYSVGPFRQAYPELSDLPILEDLEKGQRAVRCLVDYGKFRERAAAEEGTTAAALLDLPVSTGRASLTEYESKKILGAFGLPITREILAASAAEAGRAAKTIGFPVALKIQSPDVTHKSDAGGVVLGISSQKKAEQAYTQILNGVAKVHPDADIDGVLVQEMVSDGTEMILGMNNGELGPVILCGLGGIFVEVMADVALRFPPISPADAQAMLGELKGSRLLYGYRGAPKGDVDALVETIIAFAEFVRRTDGRFAAIDINPIVVQPAGQGVAIADALLVPT
jgi:acyl-CoA synthetase (NDP forming)